MRVRVLSEVHDEEALRSVEEALREVYGEEVEVEFVERIVSEKFLNKDRGQYDAWRIVKEYSPARRPDEYLLLVVEEDIYAAGLNYVFGLAWQGVSVISAHRLRQEFYGMPPDRKLFIERLRKEAVHEIGHLHGLTHCSNRKCVMAFSNWIGDTDYKSYMLCGQCRRRLERGSEI